MGGERMERGPLIGAQHVPLGVGRASGRHDTSDENYRISTAVDPGKCFVKLEANCFELEDVRLRPHPVHATLSREEPSLPARVTTSLLLTRPWVNVCLLADGCVLLLDPEPGTHHAPAVASPHDSRVFDRGGRLVGLRNYGGAIVAASTPGGDVWVGYGTNAGRGAAWPYILARYGPDGQLRHRYPTPPQVHWCEAITPSDDAVWAMCAVGPGSTRKQLIRVAGDEMTVFASFELPQRVVGFAVHEGELLLGLYDTGFLVRCAVEGTDDRPLVGHRVVEDWASGFPEYYADFTTTPDLNALHGHGSRLYLELESAEACAVVDLADLHTIGDPVIGPFTS